MNIQYLIDHCCHRIEFENDDIIVLYDNHLTKLNGHSCPYHYFLKVGDKVINLGRHRVGHYTFKFDKKEKLTLGQIRERNSYPACDIVWCYGNKILVHDMERNIYLAYLNVNSRNSNDDLCYFLFLNKDIEELKNHANNFWSPDSPNYSRSLNETASGIIEGIVSSKLKKSVELIENDWCLEYYSVGRWNKYKPSKEVLLLEHKKKGCESCQYCDFLKV